MGDIIPRPDLFVNSGHFIGVQNEAGGEAAELVVFRHLKKLVNSEQTSDVMLYLLHQHNIVVLHPGDGS